MKVSIRRLARRLAVALPLLAGCAMHAQQQRSPAGTPATATATPAESEFEVTTVKPTPAVTDGHTHINYPEGGGFSASNISLSTLMQWAYDMPEKRILNGPEWFTATRFDVQGKTDAATDGALRKMPSDEARAMKRHMVQRLLQDRFRLQVHPETRVLEAYDLVVAKKGSKLLPSQSSGRSYSRGRNRLSGSGVTSAEIAEQLSMVMGQVVVDKTDLPDRYDFTLQFAPDDAGADSQFPSLPFALEEQLGLRLVKAKEPIPVLVVDHIELPTPD